MVASHLPFPCIAFDLPGHGKSPFTPHFCPSFFQAAKHFSPFHLIGYSMGGRLALQYARQYPETIASLTLISTHLGLKTKEERTVRLEKDRLLAKRIRFSFDDFLNEWYDQPIFETLVKKFDIRSMRQNQDPQGIANALETFSLGRQEKKDVSANLIAGEHDPAYLSQYSGLPHRIIPDAGHAVHLENPTDLARNIYDLCL